MRGLQHLRPQGRPRRMLPALPVALADIVDLDQIRPDSMSRPALVNPHARPRRAGEGDASSFDAERFNEAIAKAARALDRASTIRKCHGTVRRQIDQAGAELTDMVTEARDAIGEITGLGAA